MKIIKEGVAPSKKTKEMTCSNCGCIFEAAKEEFAYQADQRGDDFWVIICPTDSCNKTLLNTIGHKYEKVCIQP